MTKVSLIDGHPETRKGYVKTTYEECEIIKRTYYLHDGRQITWAQSKTEEEMIVLDSHARWLMYAESQGIKDHQIKHDHDCEYLKWGDL